LARTASYVHPDHDAVAQAGEGAQRHISIHRRILAVGVVSALIGVALGIGMIILDGTSTARTKDGANILLAPLMFSMMGGILGTSTAIAFVPSAFLRGPMGQKWMRLVGTGSVLVARAVCLIFFILSLGIVALMAVIGWLSMS
jgi:drug/metabolite transporter (DMT)-like permease